MQFLTTKMKMKELLLLEVNYFYKELFVLKRLLLYISNHIQPS